MAENPAAFRLNPHVKLAEGVVVTTEAWALHGDVLYNGYKGHEVTVLGFPREESGILGIKVHVRPLGQPEPLRYRES